MCRKLKNSGTYRHPRKLSFISYSFRSVDSPWCFHFSKTTRDSFEKQGKRTRRKTEKIREICGERNVRWFVSNKVAVASAASHNTNSGNCREKNRREYREIVLTIAQLAWSTEDDKTINQWINHKYEANKREYTWSMFAFVKL
jgi:hypothetical protein